MKRSEYTLQQRQKEKRERHRSELEKYEKQIQSRERKYMIPPPQVQFGVTHRKTGDEAADFMQMQKEGAQNVDVSRVSTDEVGPLSLGRGSGKAPKMPYFDKKRGRFERFATCQRWNTVDWVLYLLALLTGRALDVYSVLPANQTNNYDQLKAALLKRYQCQLTDSRGVFVQLSQNPERL